MFDLIHHMLLEANDAAVMKAAEKYDGIDTEGDLSPREKYIVDATVRQTTLDIQMNLLDIAADPRGEQKETIREILLRVVVSMLPPEQQQKVLRFSEDAASAPDLLNAEPAGSA